MSQKLFYNLGHKFGSSVLKGKWYYKSVFGSEEEAIEAEYWVGNQLAKNLLQEMELSKDAAQVTLIRKIGSKLRTKVTSENRKFQFGVVISKDVNAFALPGGFIFVTDSLIDLTDRNEHELAFVLSHEILHVLLKHPFNKIVADFSSQFISNLIVKGGTLGVLAKQAISDLLRKSYSRDKEFEADSYAVRLMASVGYNPEAAEVLLKRLKKFSPENLPVYSYFLTHPPIDERIQRIDRLFVPED